MTQNKQSESTMSNTLPVIPEPLPPGGLEGVEVPLWVVGPLVVKKGVVVLKPV